MNYWEDRVDPSDAEIVEVSTSWLMWQRNGQAKDWWAVAAVMDADRLEYADIAWRLVIELCSLAHLWDEKIVLNIGSGPLGALINSRREAAMDLIEPALAASPVMRVALAAVWTRDEPARLRIDRALARHDQERA